MKHINIVLVVFLISIQILAQDIEKPLLKFNSVSIFGGSGFEDGVATSVTDFEKLATNSNLLSTDFSSFESDNYSENYTNYTAVYFNFEIHSKKESPIFRDKTLRLGVSFSNSTPFSLGYFKDEYYRIDTLTSSRTGKETYVDSVHNENYEFNYEQQSIFINAAYLINTRKESRFSFYAGLEISIGFSTNNSTELSYFEYDSFEGDHGSNRHRNDYDHASVTESYRNKLGFGIMTSIPLGVDFRVGNQREFWRKCHFIFEYKPGLSITSIPEIGSLTNTSLVSSVGVRYEF